jgi:hypothetical protein
MRVLALRIADLRNPQWSQGFNQLQSWGRDAATNTDQVSGPAVHFCRNAGCFRGRNPGRQMHFSVPEHPSALLLPDNRMITPVTTDEMLDASAKRCLIKAATTISW